MQPLSLLTNDDKVKFKNLCKQNIGKSKTPLEHGGFIDKMIGILNAASEIEGQEPVWHSGRPPPQPPSDDSQSVLKNN